MDESPLTIRDLPLTHATGKIGVRVDDEGRVWIPIGLNMRSRYLDRTNLQIAHIQTRKQWEDDQRAGVRKASGKVMVSIAECSSCHICIGCGGYSQTELYTRPVIVKHLFEWKTVCGRCAVRHFGLHFGFCVVAERDWTTEQRGDIIAHWNEAYVAKYLRLESPEGDNLFDKWRAYELQAVRQWKHDHGTVHGFLDYRQLILDGFIANLQPTAMTFTQLHGQTHGAHSHQEAA